MSWARSRRRSARVSVMMVRRQSSPAQPFQTTWCGVVVAVQADRPSQPRVVLGVAFGAHELAPVRAAG